MAMSRKDWYRRYYAKLPGNVIYVSVDHRDQEQAATLSKVMDLHSFGQFLYHDVLAAQTGGKPFTGTAEWFVRAAERGWVPRPNKPFPVAQVRQAILVYNRHTMGMFERWMKSSKATTLHSYLGFLRRHDIPISLKPITDPYTHEAMRQRHPSAAKRA